MKSKCCGAEVFNAIGSNIKYCDSCGLYCETVDELKPEPLLKLSEDYVQVELFNLMFILHKHYKFIYVSASGLKNTYKIHALTHKEANDGIAKPIFCIEYIGSDQIVGCYEIKDGKAVMV